MAKDKKWVHLRGRFPRLPINPEYADVLVAMRDTHRDKTFAELAEVYDHVHDLHDRLESALSEINAEKVALEHLMDGHLEREHSESIVLANGFRYSRSVDVAPVVEDKMLLLAWAREHMPDNLMLHSKTLEGVVKQALQQNEDFPDGVTINTRQVVKRRKA